MTKLICDKCGREIDIHKESSGSPHYRYRTYEIDLCEDCLNAWEQFKKDTVEKYNALHGELDKREAQEIAGFLGNDFEDKEAVERGKEMVLED